jgi:hypothetical protein
MTDEERNQEGGEETLEDLEAPAEAQGDVAGGQICGARSCGNPSMICVDTCPSHTYTKCSDLSKMIVVFGVQ